MRELSKRELTASRNPMIFENRSKRAMRSPADDIWRLDYIWQVPVRSEHRKNGQGEGTRWSYKAGSTCDCKARVYFATKKPLALQVWFEQQPPTSQARQACDQISIIPTVPMARFQQSTSANKMFGKSRSYHLHRSPTLQAPSLLGSYAGFLVSDNI